MKKAILLLTILVSIGFSAFAAGGPCSGAPINPVATTHDTSVCVGNMVNLIATDPNLTTGITYQWEKSASLNGTYTPVAGGTGATSLTYTTAALAGTTFFRLTASCGVNSSSSTPVLVATSSNTTPTVSVTTTATSICQGTAATYTAAASADTGATPQYKWYVNNINVVTGGRTYSYTPVNKDTITVVLVPSNTCVTAPTTTSNKVGMTVNVPAAATVAVTSSSPIAHLDTACATPALLSGVTLTAVGNGGPGATYQWFKKRGTTQSAITGTGSVVTYTPASVTTTIPIAYDSVWTIMTTSDVCATTTTATSPIKTLTVYGGKNPAASINGVLKDSVCYGTTYSITATPNYTSSRDSYQWMRNGAVVSSGSAYSFAAIRANAADSVYVIFTSSYLCPASTALVTTSNLKTVFARPTVIPTVTLNAIAPSDTVCAGTQVTFTAVGTMGGQLPVYTWTKNGVDVSNGTLYTYTATPGVDTLSIRLVSDLLCTNAPYASSPTKAVLTTRIAAVSASIMPSQRDTVCTGTPVTFMAMGSNGGTAPSFQWMKNGAVVNTGVTYSYTTSMNDTISVAMTSNAACASAHPTDTSNNIMLVVNPLPAKPVITIMGQRLMVSGAGYSVYNWYLNGQMVATTTAPKYAPTQSGMYTVSVADSNSCENASDSVSFVVLGIKNVATNSDAIKIYPNPATNMLNINATVSVHAVIYSIDGKVAIDQPNATHINIGSLANGMYIIKVSDAAGNVLKMEKIIKGN